MATPPSAPWVASRSSASLWARAGLAFHSIAQYAGVRLAANAIWNVSSPVPVSG